MAKLKVYSGLTLGQGRKEVRTVVAAPSWKRAAEIAGLSIGFMRDYWSITGNTSEIEAAMKNPETLVLIDQ
ncbi:hypothetical protein [Denitratimonas sp. CY0512]|uniref:hypothetical protein n=1 Tax=Denitratimonas sp. CY0512 TaxID=3131940 RepID=UPI00309EBDB7